MGSKARLALEVFDTRGSAAVEFALLLPLMVLLFLAALQLSAEFTVTRNFDSLTHTLADLTSREGVSPSRDGKGYLNSYGLEVNSTTNTYQNTSSVTSGELDNIFNSATAIMSPFPTSSLVMALTAVDVVNQSNGNCCQFFVRWSYSTSSSLLRPCGSLAAGSSGIGGISSALVPTAFPLTSPLSIIISDTTYTYIPLFNKLGLGSITSTSKTNDALDMTLNLSRTQYVYPRNVGQIVINNVAAGVVTPTKQNENPVLTLPAMPTTYPSPITPQPFSGSTGAGNVCY